MFTTFELYQNNMNNFKIFAQDWQLIDGYPQHWCYKWKWLPVPHIFYMLNKKNFGSATLKKIDGVTLKKCV